MTTRAPTLAEVLSVAVRNGLLDVHTALPAEVVRVDASKGLVDAKPLVKQAHVDEEGARVAASLPVVPDVPVVFPGGGGYRVTFPIAVGDPVLLVFSEGSLDRWLEAGSEVDPEDDRRHDLTDAIAIPGLRSFADPWSSIPTDHATVGKDSGVQIHLRSSTITIGDEAGADFVALAQKVKDELDAISTRYNAHTHLVANVQPGAASITSAAPLVPYTAASVAAAQAKAK